jgi:hypothetical protein
MLSRSSIPVELSFLFEDPPLLGTEDRRAYHALVEIVLAGMRSEDGVVLVFVKEFIDSTWDMQRWRNVRAALIKMSRKDALVNILESVLTQGDIPEGSDRRATAEAMADNWFADPGSSMPIRKILGRLQLSEAAIEAQAAALRLNELVALDALIESAERRRTQALSVVEIYRAGLAARMRAIPPDIIQDQQQAIPLAPNVAT